MDEEKTKWRLKKQGDQRGVFTVEERCASKAANGGGGKRSLDRTGQD